MIQTKIVAKIKTLI